ncbi:MAG TPA: hypothetical protein VFG83_13085 [Kofleriaceae bacterium]|nr:hypothetical protein [Kofleriaceae bacterium]
MTRSHPILLVILGAALAAGGCASSDSSGDIDAPLIHPSDGGEDVACSERCGGCCMGDRCLDGAAVDACGQGGAACMACGEGAMCTAGMCVVPGCAETCAGCCTDAGECVAGDDLAACGTGGQVCQMCGEHDACGESGCELDLSSTWTVVLESAHVPAQNEGGDSWDPFSGDPDVFVIVTIATANEGTEAHRSQTVDDTVDPSYNSEVLADDVAASLLIGQPIQVTWTDEDTGNPDDDMATTMITYSEDQIDQVLSGQPVTISVTDPEGDYNVVLTFLPASGGA